MGDVLPGVLVFITNYGSIFFIIAAICALVATVVFDVFAGIVAGLGLLLLATIALVIYSGVVLGAGIEDLGLVLVALAYCDLIGLGGVGLGALLGAGIRVVVSNVRKRRNTVAANARRALMIYGVALVGLVGVALVLWPLLSSSGGQ